MSPDELVVLNDKIDKLQKSLDNIDKDIAGDREYLQEHNIRMGAMESQISELRKIINSSVKNTHDKVAEAMAPMMEEAQDLKDVIMDKKVVALDSQKTKKQLSPWWRFW